MKIQFYLIVLLTILGAYSLHAENLLSVTSKTSSGECDGYCDSTLIITDQKADYTEYSTHKSEPRRHTSGKISKEEWELSDVTALQRILHLPKIIGNPGEVDQTVQTLTINDGVILKEIRFNYGELPGLESYLKVIQIVRERMEKKIKGQAGG